MPLLLFGAGLPQLARLAGEARSYAERLFDYPEIDRLAPKSARAAIVQPAKREHVVYDGDALGIILNETDGYPYSLQVWAFHAWEVAPSSPITSKHVKSATKRAITALDTGFFKMRLDRLTDRQQDYARAMAQLGPSPATSTAVAKVLAKRPYCVSVWKDRLFVVDVLNRRIAKCRIIYAQAEPQGP